MLAAAGPADTSFQLDLATDDTAPSDAQESDASASGPDAQGFRPGDFWRLPGTPVVRVTPLGIDCLVALAEKHILSGGNGSYGYTYNHDRLVLLLRRGQEPISLTFPELAPAAGFQLTDIAAGPDADSVWVASVRWNAGLRQLEPSLNLIVGLGPAASLRSYPLGAVQFPALDALSSGEIGSSYAPGEVDTLDVLRIVSDGQVLGLVGRNGSGTPYAERWIYQAGELTRAWQVPLSRPPLGLRLIMAGGTYDVMDQLSNRFKVHAAAGDSGTFFAGISASGFEVNALAANPDLPGPAPALPESLDDYSSYAMTFAIEADGRVSSRSATLIGLSDASLFMAMAAQGKRLFVGGLARDVAHASHESNLVFAEVGQAAHIIDVERASGGIQTIGFDAAGALYVGGSWNWNQNPAGLSIAGGDRFFFVLDPDHPDPSPMSLLGQGSRRSEARTCVFPGSGVMCVGGMTNGPDTHAADVDIRLIQGDGFVDCVPAKTSARE